MTASFDEAYLEHVGRMRTQFFATGKAAGITRVRPEILEGWEIAYRAGLRPDSSIRNNVSAEEFRARLERSRELMEVSTPYLEKLYDFLRPEGFFVTLTDRDGVVLKIVGDKNTIAHSAKHSVEEGSYRGVDVHHTSLINMCLLHDKPFQVVSTENSITVLDDWAGSAAPIYSQSDGVRLGLIGIHGYWRNSHIHTLGLAVLAAEAVGKQIALQDANAVLFRINTRLDTAMDMVENGAVYFDRGGVIKFVNDKALNFLRAGGTREKHVGRSIQSLFRNSLDLDKILQAVDARETLQCEFLPENGQAVLLCSFHGVPNRGKASEDLFLHLQKRSEVSKMAVDFVGSRATFTFDDIIGSSESMRSVKMSAEIASQFSSTILLTGESGNGKEMFAQAIHNRSPRANKPFIAINCAAIPRALIESELFGYEAGAFTGAQKKGQPGKFELADGGTVFLDEIGDMPFETQAILLRVLQSKEVMRVGGSKATKIDVSIIAATNQDLEECIASRTFRSDLYYRLNVITIHLPSLRERRDDIPLLIDYFIAKYRQNAHRRISGISESALAVMLKYGWPGNVRELENAIERAMIVCGGARIDPKDLPDHIKKGASAPARSVAPGECAPPPPAVSLAAPRTESLEQRETNAIREALWVHGGNISRAAEALRISRPTLYRKMRRYGLDGEGG